MISSTPTVGSSHTRGPRPWRRRSGCGWLSIRRSTSAAFASICRPFKAATNEHHHLWALIDITASFETWMAGHRYRDAYFEDPDLLETALPAFFDYLVGDVRSQLGTHSSAESVVALLGAGTLFGLGDALKVSALMNAVNDSIAGRLLVFFPGDVENNNFRLLDARDGWDYMAVVIKPNGSVR